MRNPRPPDPEFRVCGPLKPSSILECQHELGAWVSPLTLPPGSACAQFSESSQKAPVLSKGINREFIFQALCVVFYASLNTKT